MIRREDGSIARMLMGLDVSFSFFVVIVWVGNVVFVLFQNHSFLFVEQAGLMKSSSSFKSKVLTSTQENPLPAETAPAAATGERRSARKRAAETPAIADSNELNVPSSKRNRQTPLSPAPSRTLNNHRNRETPAFTEPINTSSRTRTRPIKPEPRHTSFVITSSPPPEAHQPLTNPIQTPRRKIKAEPRAYTPSMPATPAPTPQSGANQSNIAQMKEKLREEYRKKAYEESLKGMTDNGYDMEAGNTRREWLRKWFRESMEMLEEAEREY